LVLVERHGAKMGGWNCIWYFRSWISWSIVLRTYFLLYLYSRVFRHDRRPVSRPPQSRALNCEPKTDLSELAAADLRAVKNTSSWQLGLGRCPPTYIRSLSTISHGHTPALRPQCPLILFWSL
jgi:hypothetical protein